MEAQNIHWPVASTQYDCWLTSVDKNDDCNELTSVHNLLIFETNFSWVKIQKNQLPDSTARSSIGATMPFPKTNISMINPNIVNSSQSPSSLNMTDVIVQ